MARRKGLVELLRRHPAELVDDASPCQTNTRQSRPATFWQTPKTGRADWTEWVLKYPAPERRPRGNPGAWRKTGTAFPPRSGQFGVFPGRSSPQNAPAPALSFSTFAPYIEAAGSPAMEINCRRNKPFGPGGSTRRLHPSPLLIGGFRRGRNRIDEGVKGELFPGIVPPLSGYAIVANDNYAPVAQAA